IEKQTPYTVVYNLDWLSNSKPVSINAENETVEEFLAKVLKGQPFDFDVANTTIFIKRKHTDPGNSNLKYAEGFIPSPIRGKIVDSSGRPLVGASISVKSKMSAVTDNEGIFTLDVNEGDVIIVTFV